MMSETRLTPPEGLEDAEDPPGSQEAEWTPVGSEAEVAKLVGSEGPPRAPLPPSGEVSLPGGYLDQDGVLHQTARVRELNGEDEEALASFDPDKNIAAYITQLVLRGTQSVGTHPMNIDLARNLLMGDRDALVLAVRKVTFGQEIPFQIRCVDCDSLSDVYFDIDEDFRVKTLDNPMERMLSVELRNGKKAKVVLPNGLVHERVTASKGSGAEINTLMLSMCVRGIDDDEEISPAKIKALSMADRKTLLNFVLEKQPGPDLYDLKAPCHRCGRQYPVVISLGMLFR